MVHYIASIIQENSFERMAVNSSQNSMQVEYVVDNSNELAQVCAIGRRLKPDKELNCTFISSTVRAELPVTNRKNLLTSSTFILPIYQSKYPKTVCSDMDMYCGSLITFNTLSGVVCSE